MIRVFVGTDPSIHQKAEKALAYSIEQHTADPYELTFINPGWKSGCTGFTNHRFLVPSLCDYRGFAIYLDVDMLLLANIAELWSYKMPGAWCTTPMRDDVSVIDCAAFPDLKPEFVRGARKDHIRSKIKNRCMAKIPAEWNSIDTVYPSTKLIHYSDLDRQPWHPIPGHGYLPHPSEAAVSVFWKTYNRAVKND